MSFPVLTTEQIQNYGLWLQSGAIFLSFMGVIISAAVARGVARRRATLDLIMAEQSTQLLLDIRQQYIALRDAGHLVKWADPTQASGNEAKVLRAVLNRYELIAIGINEKTLNARVYLEYSRTMYVQDWIALKPFVIQRRQTTKVPKLYCELEKLAKKWANASEKEHC